MREKVKMHWKGKKILDKMEKEAKDWKWPIPFFLSVGKLAAAKKMKMKQKIFHSLPPLRRSGQVENSIPTRRLDGFNEKGSISCDPFNQFSSVGGWWELVFFFFFFFNSNWKLRSIIFPWRRLTHSLTAPPPPLVRNGSAVKSLSGGGRIAQNERTEMNFSSLSPPGCLNE